MQLISKTPEKLILRMPANTSLANALRRSVAEIPTLAIDEVELYKNDSALYDEVLSHRLGLVPLKTEKSMSGKTEINLKIQKEGPCTVYSGDLKGKAEIVYDNMPITLLDEDHKLELVATARLGLGIKHAKHIPGLFYYRHLLNVKSSQEIDNIIKNSKGLIKPEKTGSKWLCDLDESTQSAIQKKDKEAIQDSDEILVIIESYGLLDAQDIFKGAINTLSDNLDAFEKAIK